MSGELAIWIVGFAITSGGALIGTVWAMLNAKIDGQNKSVEQIRDRIADLYRKLELQRERSDAHHLEITKALYDRTCNHE
jgi:hypothetical protein